MTNTSHPAAQYVEKHFNEYLDDLKELVRIPSISFEGFPPEEVDRSAKAVAALLKRSGLENVEEIRLPGVHPYVYADWLHATNAPTVLLYAHHDVQPPMRAEVWKSPAFEPTLRDGRLYGRGTADDKAGIIVHTAAIQSFLKTTGKLPLNVKVIIEGEEEVGSGHLLDLLKKYKKKFQADIMILTDCGNYDTGVPALTTSLRGLVCLEVTVSSLDHPLHSGMWGGALPDPIMALSKILSSLVDKNGDIAVPEIRKMIRPPSSKQKKSIKELGFTEKEFQKQSGLLKGVDIIGSPTCDVLTKSWYRPSLVVNCFEGGIRKMTGNVIQNQAWARVGLRLSPGMDGEAAEKALIQAIQEKTPWNVKVDIKKDSCANPWSTDIDHPAFDKASAALKKAYKKETVFMGCGGTIPFVKPFSIALGDVPAMLVGVEDPYTNAHSENESLHLEDFKKGILGEIYMFEEFVSL